MFEKSLLAFYVFASIAVFCATWMQNGHLLAWIFAGVACGWPAIVIPETMINENKLK